VLTRRLRDLGLLLLLLAGIAACTQGEVPSTAPQIDVAVQAYTPPSAAPGFCAGLADSRQLPQVPQAVGTLVAEPGEVEATLVLTGAITELEDMLDDIRERPGFLALDRSVDELVTTLRKARDGRVTEAVRVAITEGLDDIGHRVQSVCDFPT
jgi:hypothetical protein